MSGSLRAPKEQLSTIVLVISHARKPNGERKAGIYLSYVGDELIVSSQQPFLDGARALQERGYHPAPPYDMRHANASTFPSSYGVHLTSPLLSFRIPSGSKRLGAM